MDRLLHPQASIHETNSVHNRLRKLPALVECCFHIHGSTLDLLQFPIFDEVVDVALEFDAQIWALCDNSPLSAVFNPILRQVCRANVYPNIVHNNALDVKEVASLLIPAPSSDLVARTMS